MLVSLIITLIVTLIIIAVIVSAIQQHKERINLLKRAEFSKLRALLDDSEDMMVNSANVPLSPALTQMLLKRMASTLRAMTELEPSNKELKSRFQDTENRLNNMNNESSLPHEQVTLPDNDQQLLNMVKGIKRLRTALRAEHARGNIDTQLVIQEDRRLEVLLLRINVESQIKRGNLARHNGMLGSARQYFEKAITALTNTPHQDEYTATRKSEMLQALEEIATQMREGNIRDREKKEEKENKDIDELFAPKRKW